MPPGLFRGEMDVFCKNRLSNRIRIRVVVIMKFEGEKKSKNSWLMRTWLSILWLWHNSNWIYGDRLFCGLNTECLRLLVLVETHSSCRDYVLHALRTKAVLFPLRKSTISRDGRFVNSNVMMNSPPASKAVFNWTKLKWQYKTLCYDVSTTEEWMFYRLTCKKQQPETKINRILNCARKPHLDAQTFQRVTAKHTHTHNKQEWMTIYGKMSTITL